MPFEKRREKKTHVFSKLSKGDDTTHIFSKRSNRSSILGGNHGKTNTEHVPGAGHSLQSLRGMPIRINNALEKSQ